MGYFNASVEVSSGAGPGMTALLALGHCLWLGAIVVSGSVVVVVEGQGIGSCADEGSHYLLVRFDCCQRRISTAIAN